MAPAETSVPTAPVEESIPTATVEPASPGRDRSSWRMVVAAVLVALLWPAMWAGGQGNVDALLGAGDDGPARAFVERDIPDLAPLEGIGHDGQQFYAIARHPFDPAAAGDAVDPAAYRYRRILFPFLAGLVAPDGGRPIIAAFFALSLIGVALGAAALKLLPGGPRWLPVAAALSPAVITSLTLSLSDALGAGLGLAAVAAATRRRWALAVLAATLAALTRETFLIVALGLLFTPGMPRPWRLLTLAVPASAVGAWMLWLAGRLDTSLLEGGSDQLAVPLTGYFSGDTDPQTFLMAAMAIALLGYGAWRTSRVAPHVAVVLGLQVVLLVCVSELVAFNWVNALRTAAPLLPLAIWAVVVRPDTAHADADADELVASAA